MTNSYGEKDPRRWIRSTTTDLKEAVVKPVVWPVKKGWELIPEEDRQSISEGASEFAQDFGKAWEGTKRIDNKYDPIEYGAAGFAYALEGTSWFFDKITNQIAQKTGIDPAVVSVGEMFIPGSWASKLGKVNQAKKVGNLVKVVKKTKIKPSNLNVLGDINPVVKSSSKSTILNDLNLTDAFGTNSLTQQGLGYQRRVFKISDIPLSEVQNTFIQDLSQLSGQSIEAVTQKYNKILATQVRGKRTFVGTQDQYSLVKAYFQSLHDLKITKRKSAYVVIDTVDGPKKYFADPKVSGGSRINPVSLDAKLDRQKIAGVNRWKRILNQTVHKKDIGNWHTKMAKQLGDEAHHLNELHLVAVMTDGRSADSIASVIKQINKEMIFTGNSTFNKINLPKSVHKQIHGKMREVFANYKNIDFTKMSNKELVNFFKTDYKVKMNEINETIFSEMMKSKHGKYKPK